MAPTLRAATVAESVKTQDEEDANESKQKKKRFASSWDAKAAGAEEGTKADYLSNLGQAQEYNINVTHGAAALFLQDLQNSRIVRSSSRRACIGWILLLIHRLLQARTAR